MDSDVYIYGFLDSIFCCLHRVFQSFTEWCREWYDIETISCISCDLYIVWIVELWPRRS
jgi:hypothetical protein